MMTRYEWEADMERRYDRLPGWYFSTLERAAAYQDYVNAATERQAIQERNDDKNRNPD